MPLSDQIQPRVALVTGGAKRVGRAIVERLVDAGFDVAFTFHRSERDSEALAEWVRGRNRLALALKADLTDPGAAGSVAARFREKFGCLELLVNNAGLFEPSELGECDAQAMSRLWNIHVLSPMTLAAEFGPMLRAAKGSIVNILDLLAEKPWPRYLGYCASKAGLWNLTLGLARQFAPDVTVNGIAPGVVEWSDDETPERREAYLKRVPLRHAGTPRDVAEMVHYLCNEGRYITGQIIRLDGGRSVT